jgi:hypothetical protein
MQYWCDCLPAASSAQSSHQRFISFISSAISSTIFNSFESGVAKRVRHNISISTLAANRLMHPFTYILTMK